LTTPEREQMLSAWFFIGPLLTTYGVIILAASLDAWSAPLVLAGYHPE
jgi:hypothetical protein